MYQGEPWKSLDLESQGSLWLLMLCLEPSPEMPGDIRVLKANPEEEAGLSTSYRILTEEMRPNPVLAASMAYFSFWPVVVLVPWKPSHDLGLGRLWGPLSGVTKWSQLTTGASAKGPPSASFPSQHSCLAVCAFTCLNGFGLWKEHTGSMYRRGVTSGWMGPGTAVDYPGSPRARPRWKDPGEGPLNTDEETGGRPCAVILI